MVALLLSTGAAVQETLIGYAGSVVNLFLLPARLNGTITSHYRQQLLADQE